MIELFQFQRNASASIADRFIEYLGDPVIAGTEKKPQRIPFFQALASLTASGKTVILADATAQVASAMSVAPVILWLSKGTVVVEQSYANLLPGGRYNHLISDFIVKTLAEYDPIEVKESVQPLAFFATVGTFNQKDKEEGDRLIYKSQIDDAGKTSTWDALKVRKDLDGHRRPLIVVYDEAHNLSDQQTDLLLELEPAGLLLATATPRPPARLSKVIDTLKANGKYDDWLTTRVSPKAVADSGLVKSTVLLSGYRTPMEETIDTLLADMAEATTDAGVYGLGGKPKAIYVCNTNMVATDSFRRDDPKRPFTQREAAPILIWRHLVETHGVDPSTIATYARLTFDRDFLPPPEFTLYSGDKDYNAFTAGNYTHIIFNKTLQEGWDDPYAYFAYVDRSMESRVQIEQVVGRLLRQPNAKHLPAERLNTAHFYVRVDKNETFNEVLEDVSARLNQEAPATRIIKTPPGKPPPSEYKPKGTYAIPATGYVPKDAIKPIELLIANLTDYRVNSPTNTRGVGSRRISKQQIGSGEKDTSEWETFEQSNLVSARWIFQREVKRLFVRALEVASTADGKFDARVGLGSPAYVHITDVAHKVVDTYLKNVVLVQRKVDPYIVGPVLARDEEVETFTNAIHDGYDGLNGAERDFARVIDATSTLWCRNPSRTGYGIPLITLGTTTTFYPDFLVWHEDEVIAVDTKGAHLLLEAAGRKLLNIRPHKDVDTTLSIRFISTGTYNEQVQQEDRDGFTLWSRREDGTLRADHHGDMAAVVQALLG